MIVESPSAQEPTRVVEAAAIHDQARGRTKAEAPRRFEETLDWAKKNGMNLSPLRQPEVLDYEP